MAATLIDGKRVAAETRARIVAEVAGFVQRHGRAPGLATVLVGADPASEIYVAGKHRACEEVGMRAIGRVLPADATSHDVEVTIAALNADDKVDGILCQLPVPDGLDGVALTGMIDPDKDVDGLTPINAGRLALGLPGLRPCTPAGVMELLAWAGTELRGARAVVVGRSNLFGKPMAQLLLAADATVTTAHSRTVDLPAVCRSADVLIVAIGRDRMVRADWVAPGATVIDVGMNRTTGSPPELHGDVAFEEVKDVAGAITPVPGGVGPMTIAMLLKNTLQAAQTRLSREGVLA